MTLEHTLNDTSWPRTTYDFGSLSIVATTPTEAAHKICQLSQDTETTCKHVHLVNAYTLALADKDSGYAENLAEGSIIFPDGKPLSIVSKLLHHSPPLQQIRGPQLFLDVFDYGRRTGLRHFLLGSSPEVLHALQLSLNAKYPGCEIVGSESPPFRALSSEEVAAQDERVRQARPDIVWIGLGTPKQDREARRLTEATGIMTVAVGAAFDFAAGRVPEAPTWMRMLCLEWLFRLVTEPRRLWRRYLFGNSRFLGIAFRSMVNPKLSKNGKK
ncbi:UNVERIFIED_CONTAM: WecB/TagA/CpsF family glycosyltransferase [Actinomycetes bacterium ARC8]|nr:WecB/TagA/CpsF family glycosyltransferase [Actinomycetes bacterium ARC8]